MARFWGLVNRRRARPTSRGPHEACFVGWVDGRPAPLGDGHHLGVTAQAPSHRGRHGSAVFEVTATIGVLTGQHSYVRAAGRISTANIVLEERAESPSRDAADDLSHEEPERQALIAVAACPDARKGPRQRAPR